MSITIGQALREIKRYFLSSPDEIQRETDNEQEPVTLNSDSPTESLNTNNHLDNMKCDRCNATMSTVNIAVNDFHNIRIYQCPECGMVAEYQYGADGDLQKLIHIYESGLAGSDSSILETTNYVRYDNFSLGTLWVVCGDLCYPAMIKTDFPEEGKSLMVFVKVDTEIKLSEIDGYTINDQNIISKIMITREQVMSHFYNPYLAKLPRKDFTYLAMPSTRCSSLEVVIPVRFKHLIDDLGDEVKLHRLYILKDIPIRCVGFEVSIRYITHNIPDDKPMIEVLNDIDLKSMIYGEEGLNVADGYGVQSYNIRRHTLSATVRLSIDRNGRDGIYSSISEFFTLYDRNKAGGSE